MKKSAIILLLAAVAVSTTAKTNWTIQTACHPSDVKTYDTERLREAFVMEKSWYQVRSTSPTRCMTV